MRKYFVSIAVVFMLLSGTFQAFGQAKDFDRRAMIDSLNKIDPEVMRYFPRWKICETDLQVQIYRTFKLLGADENLLNLKSIEVLAMPKQNPWDPYNLLLITCGQESMNATQIELNMGALADFISGAESFRDPYYEGDPRRDYCYQDIAPDIPATKSQAHAILNFMEPTNVDHSLTLSLFEQTLKIGSTDFWLKSVIGTDQIGYHFWESGESRIVLKRPLINNDDINTSQKIPQLLDIQLGYAYRMSSGLGGENGNNSAFKWVSGRRLNAPPGGKIVAGMDFHLPSHPAFGMHMNLELPVSELEDKAIDKVAGGYFFRPVTPIDVQFAPGDARNNIPGMQPITKVAPVLMETGQLTAFYNMWLGEKSNPDNYIRADFGISYAEVVEYAAYEVDNNDGKAKMYIGKKDVSNLKTYKPQELGDWIYAKIAYRSQSTYPFGMSAQYSNQMFLGRVYIPIFGDWFYLEAKYSTPLRKARDYEIKHFFMISPVLRLSI